MKQAMGNRQQATGGGSPRGRSLSTRNRVTRLVGFGAVLTAAACKPATAGPELGPLSAADTTCTSIPQTGARLRSGVARLVTLRTTDAGRGLAIGLDSSNRLRLFDAMKVGRDPGVMQTQMLTVMVDVNGRIIQATRTFMTRDMATGTGDSRTVKASTSDTTRARELMAEVIRRCVR